MRLVTSQAERWPVKTPRVSSPALETTNPGGDLLHAIFFFFRPDRSLPFYLLATASPPPLDIPSRNPGFPLLQVPHAIYAG